MFECGNYLMIASQKDWDSLIKEKEIRIDSDRFYYRGGYGRAFPVSFPCFYKYIESMDVRSNGDWRSCDNYEAATFINAKIIKRISRLKEVQEKIKPFL